MLFAFAAFWLFAAFCFFFCCLLLLLFGFLQLFAFAAFCLFKVASCAGFGRVVGTEHVTLFVAGNGFDFSWQLPLFMAGAILG